MGHSVNDRKRIPSDVENQASDGEWALPFSRCHCGRPRISSKCLFPDGSCELCIEHEGLEYCLRITKQKKLILYR